MSDDEPDWIVESAKEQKLRENVYRRLELEGRLAKVREKEKLQRDIYKKGEPSRKKVVIYPLSMTPDKSYFSFRRKPLRS